MNKVKNELTPEEQAKPYAKYFYRTPAVPDPKQLALMGKPIDPALTLPLERLNDLLDPGYLPCEAGWCVLPNGGAFIANHTRMPGVTAAMFEWWFAWHGLENLRYKIWWPAGHYSISMSDKDRAKVLDPNLTMAQKCRRITHHVVEDVGGGPENIYIGFMAPEECGFDMDRFKPPHVHAMVAGNGASQMIHPPPGVPNFKAPAFMCHIVREIAGGIDLRTRFWLGSHIIEKKPYHLLPVIARIPEFVPRGLAIHNVHEFTNLASFLPEIYAEQKGLVP